MKNLVIYHDHCTDGFGAAFAAWLILGDKDTEYLPVNYGQINTMRDFGNLLKHPIEKDTTVYILDFSFPRTVMDYIFETAKEIVWLDHHKTSFEMYDLPATVFFEDTGTSYIGLDNDQSGAMLAWNYFHPATETPLFIRHIDDYDRWQFKIPESKAFNAAMVSMKPWSFVLWNSLFSLTPSDYDDAQGYHNLYLAGRAIVRAHDVNVKSAVDSSKKTCVVGDATGLAANTTHHLASDAGHMMANESGTFGLCWYMGRNGMAKCSFRSNGNYDVSIIAKAFGGGGHRNASGAEVDMSTLMGWLK